MRQEREKGRSSEGVLEIFKSLVVGVIGIIKNILGIRK